MSDIPQVCETCHRPFQMGSGTVELFKGYAYLALFLLGVFVAGAIAGTVVTTLVMMK